MNWSDEDSGLPIKFGPCSNAEYEPEPLSDFHREVIRRAREACEANARRTGMSRREFLLSLCVAATTLFILDACTREATRRTPGGRYTIPPEATTDPDAAREVLGGEEFVFDIQGHLLEYDLNPDTRGEYFFGQVFPQTNCPEEDDPRACFSIEHFLELMFIRSDTTMVVLSSLPIAPEGSPLSLDVMEETRRLVEALCRDERILMHAQALPNVGQLQANLDVMQATVESHPIAAWKVFTNYPDLYEHNGDAWRLDDGDPALAQVGEAFIQKAIEVGVPTICSHKGFSTRSPYATPADIGPAARKHRDANFVVYHSGFESTHPPEGPYTAATSEFGINRLIKSMKDSGIGPNENVYAELGSTWWYVMRSPEQAAHVIGKLLKYVGEDNVLWGTDCLFYGSPQDQIQALRALEISDEYQERYGYPKLTREIKNKILGLNGARLYNVEPITDRCEFTRRQLEEMRKHLPGRNTTLGPRTSAEVREFHGHHQGWPG
ncbi:MAG TPA: amidohydrolase family protein [Actinomycetota bacterium]|nr:amidohydrolase family protein [Actinomycetota bacterium]